MRCTCGGLLVPLGVIGVKCLDCGSIDGITSYVADVNHISLDEWERCLDVFFPAPEESV